MPTIYPNYETKGTNENWSFGEKFSHTLFGGKQVKVNDDTDIFVYKYDGVFKRLLGNTIGLIPRGIAWAGRAMGIYHKEWNPLASKEWKLLTQIEDEQVRARISGSDSYNPTLAEYNAGDLFLKRVESIQTRSLFSPGKELSSVGKKAESKEGVSELGQALTESAKVKEFEPIASTSSRRKENPPPLSRLNRAGKSVRFAEINDEMTQTKVQNIANTLASQEDITVDDSTGIENCLNSIVREQQGSQIKGASTKEETVVVISADPDAGETEDVIVDKREMLKALQTMDNAIRVTIEGGLSVAALAGLAIKSPQWAPVVYEFMRSKLSSGATCVLGKIGDFDSNTFSLSFEGTRQVLRATAEQLQSFLSGAEQYMPTTMQGTGKALDSVRDAVLGMLRGINEYIQKQGGNLVQSAALNALTHAMSDPKVQGLGIFISTLSIYALLRRNLGQDLNDVAKEIIKTAEMPTSGKLEIPTTTPTRREKLFASWASNETLIRELVEAGNRAALKSVFTHPGTIAGGAAVSTALGYYVLKNGVPTKGDLSSLQEAVKSGGKAIIEQVGPSFLTYIKDSSGKIVGSMTGSLDELMKMLPKEMPKVSIEFSSKSLERYITQIGEAFQKTSLKNIWDTIVDNVTYGWAKALEVLGKSHDMDSHILGGVAFVSTAVLWVLYLNNKNRIQQVSQPPLAIKEQGELVVENKSPEDLDKV